MNTTNHPMASDLSALSQGLTAQVRARLGHRMMTLEDVAALDIDGIIAFDKAAGETLEIMVGNVHLGAGEIVVVDDRLAIRITELHI